MKKELLTRFMEKRIVELKKEQRNGTAHVYQSTLNRLKNFMNGREITFSQLTPEWLALFEQKLLADQLKWNTISTYMRMLRSVYNQALERGVATYVPRLFNKVHTGIDCPVKRAVSPEVICRLMTDRKPLPGKLAFSRDLFVLLFLLRGMPFVDLAFLRRCDLQGNVITYHRRKTSRKLTVWWVRKPWKLYRNICMQFRTHLIFSLLYRIPVKMNMDNMPECYAFRTIG